MSQSKYPYLIRRGMAAVYQRHAIYFEDLANNEFSNDSKIVLHKKYKNDDDSITVEGRFILESVVADICIQSRQRYCIVYSEIDCLYIEPDGTSNRSNQPPSGGVKL